MSNLKYFSMFSGVGGFELGIQRAFDNRRPASSPALAERDSSLSTVSNGSRGRSHATCIGYSEIDKYAITTYEHNFKGHRNYGDATQIDERELPDFDLLVGGFPCQAFSIAGKRAGFNDTRGTLFFDIARILKHKRPRHLVLENVKGLLSHDSGKTFTTIIGVLTDLGYDIEWQVLNAKDFGVPQNRERIFIVGHLGGECTRKIFPIRQHGEKTTELPGQYEGAQAVGTYIAEGKLDAQAIIRQFGETRFSDISPTLRTPSGGNRLPFIAAQRGRDNGQVLEPQIEDKTNTLTAVAKDNYLVDPPRIRRLTPTECERLMSWPDGWTIGSDTQRYKQCGNGVVSNVVTAVIEGLNICLV